LELVVCWALFPALLLVLATGCGALVDAVAGGRLPTLLLPPLGFAAIVVGAQFLTLADATAELAVPATVVAAVCGLLLLARDRPRPDGWALIAAVAVFAAYAAPIVLSGEATFAGFIRLDDTATWMALTDRVMEHGRSLDGLAPSTYEATLAFNLADGYPVGVFLPLGIGRGLVGEDVAWLIQPYMAWIAALLALALWPLARALVRSPRWCALAVFVAAQPALLYGYYLWGGVKELAAAMLLAALGACAGALGRERWSLRLALAPALLAAALVGVLSAGGLLWLVPAAGATAIVLHRRLPWRVLASRTAWLAVLVAALSVPVLATGGALPPNVGAADRRRGARQPDRPAGAGAGRRHLAGRRLPARS
jgi:hypothetical protein